ncbi:MAG: hypothetical protein KF889_27675 [Alphaproteobacteria bacterium]|nr:hypothetical protein [Alphaproteobacteria bacterium]MCW5743735.1 hypothetical protein [Alphaproteobacteria bacterium]
MSYNTEAIAREMVEFAAGIAHVRVEGSIGSDGVLSFLATVPAEIAEGTLMSLCQGWARLIRKSVPDRPDDWSSDISVRLPWGPSVGLYALGWIGHEDEWLVDDPSNMPDTQEWETLHQRLDEYLGARGKSDWRGGGDYYLFEEESGHADQSVTIYRIEFLTPDLVNGIQEILRDGYSTWIVYVVLDLLPPVIGIASDGLEIHADRVVEKWDRAVMVERLGARLKV